MQLMLRLLFVMLCNTETNAVYEHKTNICTYVRQFTISFRLPMSVNYFLLQLNLTIVPVWLLLFYFYIFSYKDFASVTILVVWPTGYLQCFWKVQSWNNVLLCRSSTKKGLFSGWKYLYIIHWKWTGSKFGNTHEQPFINILSIGLILVLHSS